MPEDTTEICDCPEAKQAVLKETFPNGKTVYLCRPALKEALELLKKLMKENYLRKNRKI